MDADHHECFLPSANWGQFEQAGTVQPSLALSPSGQSLLTGQTEPNESYVVFGRPSNRASS
jgi:hypothetical protein